jgi:hypothetical protein
MQNWSAREFSDGLDLSNAPRLGGTYGKNIYGKNISWESSSNLRIDHPVFLATDIVKRFNRPQSPSQSAPTILVYQVGLIFC